MPAERFDFSNAAGERLPALLDCPAGPPRAYALFAHCFTCGKDIHAARRIAEGLTALGIAVLRFDFTGLGSSEGEFANTTFSSNVSDLVAAADALRSKRSAPGILIGHSLGGAAVLAAAGEVPEARAVVTIAAPADPAHVAGLFKDRIDEIEATGRVDVTMPGARFPSAVPSSTISAGTGCAIGSVRCARPCSSSIHRPTISSASRMQARFSPRQSIRRASSRLLEPIIS